MAILDNASWLNPTSGYADSGSQTIVAGSNSTTVTGTFTSNVWQPSGTNSDFAATNISSPVHAKYEFSNPVENLSFKLESLDQNGTTYDEKFTIYAYDRNGDLLPSATVIAGLSQINQEAVTVNPDGSVSIEANGATANDVSLYLTGPVSAIDLVFEPGEDATVTGVAGISDLTFDIPVKTSGVVEGTSGDDVINTSYAADPEGDKIDNNDATGVNGTTGNQDVVRAGAGNDTVIAGDDNDQIWGGRGIDSLFGGVGNDLIYGGDDSDYVSGADGIDSLFGGAGDDTVVGGIDNDVLMGDAGNDVVFGGDGNDEIEGNDGNDTLYGDGGDDHIFGRDGADILYGGVGNDTLIGGLGIDTLYGGDGNDTLAGSQGSDTIYGGAGDDLVFIGVPAPGDIPYTSEGNVYLEEGNDFLDGSDATLSFEGYGGAGNDTMEAGVGDDYLIGETGNDVISGGQGDDTMVGSAGDDVFVIEDNFGNDSITGGDTVEVTGDTLDMSAVTSATVIDLTNADAEIGSVSDGTSTLTYAQIERIILGQGTDTLVLADGSGSDTVEGFSAPTDNGDGTFSGNDQLNVSGLTDATGNPVDTNDVVVTDDGAGNAVLNFPNGENLTLIGVSSTDANDPAYLVAMGIPMGSDGIVRGTTGNDLITTSYVDNDGDQVDGSDGLDDVIETYGGDDVVYAGFGNDIVDGGDGNDQLFGDDGSDTIFGGAGNDTLTGGAGPDYLYGGDDADFFYGGIGDAIDGGEGGNDFDTLDLTDLGGKDFTNVIYGGGNNESGTVQVLDGSGNVVGTFSFDNIEQVIPCFTPGTMIMTRSGETPVEDLVVGDLVLTRDDGYCPIRWVGSRTLDAATLAAQPNLNPICIRKGALGFGQPERDTMVSSQHRMLLVGPQAQMLFGDPEVLVAATHMINDSSILRLRPRSVTYIHLLFDQHEIVRANGSWTESFQPGSHTLSAMDQAQREEVYALFPELRHAKVAYPSARQSLRAHEARVLLQVSGVLPSSGQAHVQRPCQAVRI